MPRVRFKIKKQLHNQFFVYAAPIIWFYGEVTSPGTAQMIYEFFECSFICFQYCWICLEPWRFKQFSRYSYRAAYLCCRAHFVAGCCDQGVGVLTHFQAKLSRCLVGELHLCNFIFKLIGRSGDVPIPVNSFFCHPNSEKVLVVWTITKPASHLQQRIIHLRFTIEITDSQPLQRQASGQAVAANCNNAQAIFFVVEIIQTCCPSSLVNCAHCNRGDSAV